MTAMSPLSEPLPPLELLSAERRFPGGVLGLQPTTLKVLPGEFITLIGPSGCGKSTLLRMAAGLDEPSDGRVQWWRGKAARLGEEGRRLAFVFQEATLMPWASAERNVALPLELAGVPRAQIAPRVEAALAQVGLTDRAGHLPRQLSGGMRMRVSIARALVTRPDLLLMDEPFGALDEFSRNHLDEALLWLAHEQGLTTLFVTHSIYEAVFLSTRVVVMAANPGRIFAEYRIDEPLTRGEAFRESDAFAGHVRQLSRILHQAATASQETQA